MGCYDACVESGLPMLSFILIGQFGANRQTRSRPPVGGRRNISGR